MTRKVVTALTLASLLAFGIMQQFPKGSSNTNLNFPEVGCTCVEPAYLVPETFPASGTGGLLESEKE